MLDHIFSQSIVVLALFWHMRTKFDNIPSFPWQDLFSQPILLLNLVKILLIQHFYII